MKLNLWSKLTMKIISKVIEKKVKTLLGDTVEIQVNNCNFANDKNGRVHLHADIDASMSEDELKTYLLKLI